MSEQTTGEKQEKHDEKEEKERGEKFRNDPLSAVIWALILIWAGLVFLGQNLLPSLYHGWEPWTLVVIGAGVIVLLEAVVRTLRPEYRRPIAGTVIFGVILIAVGLGEQPGWDAFWPVPLIIAGVGLRASDGLSGASGSSACYSRSRLSDINSSHA